MTTEIQISIIMPCLNEEKTLAICIQKIQKFLISYPISGEIIVGDNGSTDDSVKIAISSGAKVVHVKEKGYGNAIRGALSAAKGKYIIIGDSDDSYDFENLIPFIEKLEQGFDVVIGNRFKGGIEKKAMPFLHKYLGNPALTFIGNLFFDAKIYDFQCGLRGIRKTAADLLQLNTPGMEFASEMIVKSCIQKLKITEVPTPLFRDGRNRPPHLNTWRDGWRHLKFLIEYRIETLRYFQKQESLRL